MREILLIGLIISFLEVLVRYVRSRNKIFYPEIRIKHPRLGTVHKPNSRFVIKGPSWRTIVETNSLGFRDEEHNVEKDSNISRILWLGDSWVAAIRVPYDRTFPEVIKELLEIKDSIKTEMIKFAVGGWCQRNQLAAFREYGKLYKPDLTILVVYPHNDIYENYWKEEVRQENRDMGYLGYLKKLFRRSYIVRLSWALIHSENPLRTIKEWVGMDTQIYGFPEVFNVYRKDLLNHEWRYAYQETVNLILTIREEVRSSGSDFMVVLVPSPWQVIPDLWQSMQDRYPELKRYDWDLNQPHNFLRKVLEKEGCYVVDLLSYMKNRNDIDTCYFKEVDHLNEYGERVVADLLYEHVKGRLQNIKVDKEEKRS